MIYGISLSLCQVDAAAPRLGNERKRSVGSSLTVDVFLSVDGWAGSDGLPGYFGYLGPELAEWIKAEGAVPQLVIMGRRTYELLAGLPEEFRDEGWHRMSRLDKVVFSRTLTQVSWPNTRLSRGSLADEVRAMKDAVEVPLRTMGSLSVARQLLDAGLVDRLRLMIFPLIAGPPGREAAFQDTASADLELVDHQALDGRVLLVEY
jgi:dihydrofolate reductase